MIDLIIGIIIVGLLTLVFLRSYIIRTRSLRQKKKYAQKFNVNISSEDLTSKIVFSILGEKFALSKNVIYINQKCSWQEFEYTFVTVSGGLSKQIDTLYLPYKFPFYRVLSNKLCLGKFKAMPSLGDQILKFLKTNDLSLDSGDWGALLIKNKGTFNFEEVDFITAEFLSLITAK